MTFIGFANVVALWGLLSLPAVLALHLLRQRQQRYDVSSLTLWSFLEHEVRGSRLRRIPLSLLLLIDLLIALLLTLAWAQPQIRLTRPPDEGRQLFLLLDSSASMGARDSLPSRYEQAKVAAIELLTALGPRDAATVISFGARPTVLGDTRSLGLAELIAAVSAAQAGEVASTALPAALAMAQAAARPGTPREVHIFTDAAFPQLAVAMEEASLTWHLYGNADSNQAVFDVQALAVADGWQVFARIANFGSGRAQRIVTLFAGDQVVESNQLEILPGASVAQLWSLSGEPAAVTVQLAGSDALPEDDSASLGLHRAAETRVGIVASDPEPLQRALSAVPGATLRLLEPDEYTPGMRFDLTIFRGVVPPEWPAGAALLVDPPAPAGSLALGPDVLLDTVAVPAADPLLTGIDFAGVRWGPVRELTPLPPGYVSLLQAGETPLFVRGESERGLLYLLLAELGGGNLQRHPAFPLLLASLVDSVAAGALPQQIGAGEPLPLPQTALYPQLVLVSPDGARHDLGHDRPDYWPDTLLPGRYSLEMIDASGQAQTIVVGANAGSQAESNIRPGSWPENRTAGPLEPATGPGGERTMSLMPWLLAAAAVLLLLEAVLAWR